MSSQKKECLLGNKRSKRSESEDSDNESSEESDDGQPVKSIFSNPKEQGFSTGGLFGNSNSNTSKGLFGDLSNASAKPKSLFGDSLFKPTSGSLFGNSNSSGLFSSNSSLFNNINNTVAHNNKDEEEENENDDNEDNNDKPASPNKYNPENEIGCDENAFHKIYVKKVESFYLFSKGDDNEGDKKGKYVNRGEGFLSIETKDDKESAKRFAVVMMRNTIGNVLCEGILNEKFNKFISYEKKFKHVAHFYFLVRTNDEKNKDKTKIEAGNAKVPYSSEDEMKKFEEKYKEAIEFLKGKEEEKEKEKEKENGKSD